MWAVRGAMGAGGRLEVILGPMFAGKTTELLRRVRRLQAAEQRVVVVKSSKDTRGAAPSESTVTHDGVQIPAYAAERLADVPAALLDGADVVGVDEGQFYDDVMPVADAWASAGKVVIVASLDGSFLRSPFPHTGALVAAADTVDKLAAVCSACRSLDAPFSHRFAPSAEVELIGGAESYAAMCRACYLAAAAPAPP